MSDPIYNNVRNPARTNIGVYSLHSITISTDIQVKSRFMDGVYATGQVWQPPSSMHVVHLNQESCHTVRSTPGTRSQSTTRMSSLSTFRPGCPHCISLSHGSAYSIPRPSHFTTSFFFVRFWAKERYPSHSESTVHLVWWSGSADDLCRELSPAGLAFDLAFCEHQEVRWSWVLSSR